MLVGQTNKKLKFKYGKFEADWEAEKAVLFPLWLVRDPLGSVH